MPLSVFSEAEKLKNDLTSTERHRQIKIIERPMLNSVGLFIYSRRNLRF